MEWAEELIAAFRADALARGRSPRTLLNQAAQQRDFFRFCAAHEVARMAEVTLEVVETYQRDLAERISDRGRPLAPRTQRRMLQELRSFLGFLVRSGRLLVDPSRELDLGRPCSVLPELLSPREVRRLLTAPDPSTAMGVRDRAVLACLYETGMRLSELTGLRLDDVDFEAHTLTIRHGKGDADRTVPMGEVLRQALLAYVAAARDRLLDLERGRAEDPGTVFLSLMGRALAKPSVQQLVARYGRLAGLKKHVHPHLLRHACATHLVEAGADIRVVQELLGHRRLSTTERYVRMTLTNLKRVHRKNHPREKEAAGA